MTRRLSIGVVIVDIDDITETVTTYLPGAAPLIARGHDDQATIAADLGYATVWQLNREHDPMHSRLADMLTGKPSPTLHGLAHGYTVDPNLVAAEEAMVLATQRFLNLWRNETRAS